MKITKTKLKQIIKEELGMMEQSEDSDSQKVYNLEISDGDASGDQMFRRKGPTLAYVANVPASMLGDNPQYPVLADELRKAIGLALGASRDDILDADPIDSIPDEIYVNAVVNLRTGDLVRIGKMPKFIDVSNLKLSD